MTGASASARIWRRAMVGRDPTEEHRAATPLELLFDLCFVAAVAQAGTGLDHAIVEGEWASGVGRFVLVFFSIWWAWMNFTWFASAYDNDDVVFRLTTMVQISGGLVLAAGVARGFEGDYDVIFVGYAIMRVGLVAQWLRAAYADEVGRPTAVRYAVGVSACMVGWTVLLLTGWPVWGFCLAAVVELVVPACAEHARGTPWHPEHIAERYGLFTIIVLGESIIAATVAFQAAFDEPHTMSTLVVTGIAGLLIVFSMWWIYFAKFAARQLVSNRTAFTWGYGHYVVFAAVAAVGAGLAVNIERSTDHAELSAAAAGAAVTIPAALFLLAVWVLYLSLDPARAFRSALIPIAAVLVLGATFVPQPVLVTGILVAVLVASSVAVDSRTRAEGEPDRPPPTCAGGP